MPRIFNYTIFSIDCEIRSGTEKNCCRSTKVSSMEDYISCLLNYIKGQFSQ